MDIPAEARRCLEDLDVVGMRRVSAHIMPHIAQGSDKAVLSAMHIARTLTESLPLWARAYSHRWLVERGLPSQLPDHLRPKAERMYPKIASAVGLGVTFKAPELKPAGDLIRKAGEAVIEDCYADGRQDPAYVKPRMLEAIARERKALFGHISSIPGRA